MAEDAEDTYEVTHSVCHACVARERKIDAYQGEKQGRYFIVERGTHG